MGTGARRALRPATAVPDSLHPHRNEHLGAPPTTRFPAPPLAVHLNIPQAAR